MKISQLIASLKKIQDANGDLDITRPNGMGSLYNLPPTFKVDNVLNFGDEEFQSDADPILYRYHQTAGLKPNRVKKLIIK